MQQEGVILFVDHAPIPRDGLEVLGTWHCAVCPWTITLKRVPGARLKWSQVLSERIVGHLRDHAAAQQSRNGQEE